MKEFKKLILGLVITVAVLASAQVANAQLVNSSSGSDVTTYPCIPDPQGITSAGMSQDNFIAAVIAWMKGGQLAQSSPSSSPGTKCFTVTQVSRTYSYQRGGVSTESETRVNGRANCYGSSTGSDTWNAAANGGNGSGSWIRGATACPGDRGAQGSYTDPQLAPNTNSGLTKGTIFWCTKDSACTKITENFSAVMPVTLPTWTGGKTRTYTVHFNLGATKQVYSPSRAEAGDTKCGWAGFCNDPVPCSQLSWGAYEKLVLEDEEPCVVKTNLTDGRSGETRMYPFSPGGPTGYVTYSVSIAGMWPK